MLKRTAISIVLSLFAASMAFAASTSPINALAKLPLRFERNDGQTDCEVAYLSRGRGSTLFLTRTEAVLSLRNAAVLRLRMIGANADPIIAGEEQLQGTMNFFIGNDPTQWRTGVPTYRRVRYDDVWPGIDLVWHGRQNALEYDFLVAPGVDPSAIRLQVDGAKRLRLDASGNLIAETAAGDVVQHAPVLYQDGPGGRTPVAGNYVLRGATEVAFRVGAYDAARTLVIDPVLEYATYLGGSHDDDAFGIAVDAQGNAYVTGPTDSADFPRGDLLNDITNAWIFIAKLNADGSDLIYSSLIGAEDYLLELRTENGNSFVATAIAVAADGKACITGMLDNTDNRSNFPVTENAFQTQGWCFGVCSPFRETRGVDAFVTMLSADGRQLVYSTFYGGNKLDALASFDRGEAIAVDDAGRIHIAGVTNSNDLPMKNGFQPSRESSKEGLDAFIAVFDPSQERGNDTLFYASFLGGSEDDHALGIAVDRDRNAYVGGKTRSRDLKTKAPVGQSLPVLQPNFKGGTFDGFVAKVNTEGLDEASLKFLTYFGGDGNDRVEAVAVDAFHQRAFIAGATNSNPESFPLLNALDSTQTNGEAFVAKLNGNGTALFYSTFLGGENGNGYDDFEEATGIAVDDAGNAYVAGNTSSGDTFPSGGLEPPLRPDLRGTVFVAKIGRANSATVPPQLVYSTTFGGAQARARGIAVDLPGNAYIAGFTGGEFPATERALQPVAAGGRDAFIAKIASRPRVPDTTGVYDPARNEFQLRNSNTPGGADLIVPFGAPGDLPVGGDWDGDGVTDVGVYRPERSEFLLRLGSGTVVTIFGGGLNDLPVAGDWDGDGFDTPGFFNDGGRTGQRFFLTNARVGTTSSPDFGIIVTAGQPGDLPLAGDWDGDGLDTVGFFRPSTNTFFQIDDLAAGVVARSFVFGDPGDLPLAGDWDANGKDDVGVFRPLTRTMRLTTDLGVTAAREFDLEVGEGSPVGGDWDGQ